MQVYLHIYNIYSTNTTLLPSRCMTLKWYRTDVYATLSRRINVILTSCVCWVSPRQACLKLSDLENEIYRVQYGVFPTIFGHKWLLFFICSAWSYVKELENIIARKHCFMHRSLFRPNYIFNNDAYFLDFRAQKFPLIFFIVSPF